MKTSITKLQVWLSDFCLRMEMEYSFQNITSNKRNYDRDNV
jgi:hypothetical protein